MSVPFSTFATGVVTISIIHSLVPHHWLPFVIVGRAQGWKTKKTLFFLGLGALAHTLSTIAIGLLVGYLGQELDKRIEVLHGVVPGLILFAFGGGFFLSSFNHTHHEISERMAASSLIVMLALSPCLVVAPAFLLMGPLDVGSILLISLCMSALSVAGMMLLGWIALKGLNTFKLHWLEKNEPRIMGSLLMLLGLIFIIH
jgi:nickel/cobalt transporter (NicO) family protein